MLVDGFGDDLGCHGEGSDDILDIRFGVAQEETDVVPVGGEVQRSKLGEMVQNVLESHAGIMVRREAEVNLREARTHTPAATTCPAGVTVGVSSPASAN